MNRGITRIALVWLTVLGVFALTALAVGADPGIPTQEFPSADQPGPRVALWLSPMPRRVFVDGESFELQFQPVPLTGSVVIWDMDVSTYMTLGSEFQDGATLSASDRARLASLLEGHGFLPDPMDPTATLQEVWRGLQEAERSQLLVELNQIGFVYEPWTSALRMLERFWTETGLCNGMLNLVGGPGGSRMVHYPCLAPQGTLDALIEHGPTGWYEFSRALTETIEMGSRLARQGFIADVYVVNRGPVLDEERDLIPDIIDQANAAGVRIHVIPMGNEPGPRMRFPWLDPLEKLARGTGGKVYYAPNLQNIHDFSMLPAFVPQMMQDYYGRMSQIDRGARVATRAELVIVPSQYVQITSPATTEIATGTAGVRLRFNNLRVGYLRPAEISFQVTTSITGTLLPVFNMEASYFRWIDLAGVPHQLPLPQRVISVTDSVSGAVSPTVTPTQAPTVVPPTEPVPEPPTPTPTWTETPDALPAETPSATATPTPTPTPSFTPASTHSPTATATFAATPVHSPTTTPTPTATPRRSPTPTTTFTWTPTDTPTARPTFTPRPTRTATSTPPRRQTPRPTTTTPWMPPPLKRYSTNLPFIQVGIRRVASDPYPSPQNAAAFKIPILDSLFTWLVH